MSETTTVCYLVNGTTVEDTHTADRITHQQWPDGRALITIYHDGQATEWVSYRQAERIRRVVTPKDA